MELKMKIKLGLLLSFVFATTLAWGDEGHLPHFDGEQNKGAAPENTEHLTKRMAALRDEVAPFLRSFPTQLDVRERDSLSGEDWAKHFEVEPRGKTEGVARPAWEKVGLDVSQWKQARVPEWLYTEQYAKTPASCILWYRKIFKAAQIPDGKRVFLVFEGVDWEAEVWLNGHKLGGHSVYIEPFRFDVTDVLSKSGENTLAVRVIDGPFYGEPAANWGLFPIPPAKEQRYVRDRSKSLGGLRQGDMHIGGGYGIFGEVYLETTGSSAISELLVRGYPARQEAVVQVFSDVAGTPPASIKVELLAENFKGKSYSQTVPFKSGKKSAQQTVAIKMPDARRWSSETPWLYRCRVSLLNATGSVVDTHDALFGHRTIEMVSSANPKEGLEEGMLLLNGEPMFLRGTNIQGLNALSFWGETETLKNVLLLLKAANFNAVRSCQHLQLPEVRELMDRLGIMSQQDVGSRYPTRRESPAKVRTGLINACEVAARVLYNNPGVVLLSLANETEFDPTEMVESALKGDSERILVPISGRLSRIRPDQYPKWVSKEYYSWHHTYIINKDAWKGTLPESMRCQVLDSIHPYWGWYPEKGQLHNWCRIQVPGRMLQVGEYGSEALDGYETMKDYPAAWGKTPSKNADVLWGHVQVVKDDVRQVVGFRGKHPASLEQYIEASQTYQYDQLAEMTKAWRLSPKRIAAYFQFHFIDVIPANWPKSIISHDLTPKRAYFAMAQVNQPLVPLPRLLSGGNEMELWVANHEKNTYEDCQIEWAASSKGHVLAKGSQKVDVLKFGVVLAGTADLSRIETSAEVVDIRLVLKDSKGRPLSSYTQEIYLHAWRKSGEPQFPFRKETTAWIEAENVNIANATLAVDESKFATTSAQKGMSVQPAFHPGKPCSSEWKCTVSSMPEKGELWVRHAGDTPVRIRLYIDNKPLGTFTLGATKGWGYKEEEWAWTAISLPPALIENTTSERNDFLESERKQMKIRFEFLSRVNINLDCIALASSELKHPAGTRAVKLSSLKQIGSYSIYHSFDEMYAATDSILPPLKDLTKGPKHHWFGYYLHDQLDASGRYLLAGQVNFEHRLQKPTDVIKVGMIDLQDNNKWIPLGESRAWSWQQGCFLQWCPGSDTEVVWNDREGNVAVARVFDIKTRKMRTLPMAIDEAISPDGKWALCSDFSRTWKASPGYGYPGIENDSTQENSPTDAGIWRMNMDTGETQLLVSLADLKNYPGNRGEEDRYCYVAHFDWSPDGKRFSAYYRSHWTVPTRVYTFAADGSDMRLLSETGASHWAWRDNSNVMIWTHNNGKDVGYQMYKDDGSGKAKSLVWKAPNGHQTYIPGTQNEWMVTDTYPQGSKREQILHLVHIPTQRFIPLARLPSPNAYKGHWRCDLHPRVSRDGKMVFVDSPHGGNGRQIYRVDIAEIIRKAIAKQDSKTSGRQSHSWDTAAKNGELAREGFERSNRSMHGWLKKRFGKSMLYGDHIVPNHQRSLIWRPQDAAADCYPFHVLAASLTEQKAFDGPLLDMLMSEIKYTSRDLGDGKRILPDWWNIKEHRFVYPEADSGRIAFGVSEYCKDGLMPISEWLGPKTAWYDRMIRLTDYLWTYQAVGKSTRNMPVPLASSNLKSRENIEAHGEQLQILPRLYWCTGDDRYKEWAIRLGDHYLLGNHHPTESLDHLRLRDHGNEIISGLSETYAMLSLLKDPKAESYRKPLYRMLDFVLAYGRNEDGLFYDDLNIKEKKGHGRTADNFGYVFNAFYIVYMIDKGSDDPAVRSKVENYRKEIIRALKNLDQKKYRNFSWEGSSSDGYADAIEGALNLYNRERLPRLKSWIESEIKVMWAMQGKKECSQLRYPDGNFCRTSLMYSLWKTRGVHTRDWRKDLAFGATETGDGRGLIISAVAHEDNWSGKLIFDHPRHQTFFNMPLDYPRINSFPEWFTVKPESIYEIINLTEGCKKKYKGSELLDGLEVRLVKGLQQKLVIKLMGE